MDKEVQKEPEDTKADHLVRLSVMLGNYETLPTVDLPATPIVSE